MVFYFTCSDPRYTIYMGRDKYENEELIRYGWPEDLWFHVDKHSSAHVYLRLPREETIADVPAAIVHECAQLTKLNSIDGCKLNDVTIVYTMWGNLRKTGDMATGQIGFHKKGEVRSTVVHARVNDIVNRLNKTKVEKHNNPAELFELKQQRDAAELAESKAAASEARKGAALEKDAARQAASQARRESAERAAAAEEETEAAQALFANLAAGDVTFGGDDDAVYGASSDDDDGFGGGGGGEAGLDTALDGKRADAAARAAAADAAARAAVGSGGADAQFVRDSLALAFYEASVGAPVVHAWAEWLRDEWIAKLP